MRLRIKELRDEFQITQKSLADLLSNSQRNVSNWESGASEPDCETILKIADIFQISLDELFGRIPAPVVGPDGKERKLLRLFRRLNEEQQNALYQMLASFTQPL